MNNIELTFISDKRGYSAEIQPVDVFFDKEKYCFDCITDAVPQLDILVYFHHSCNIVALGWTCKTII